MFLYQYMLLSICCASVRLIYIDYFSCSAQKYKAHLLVKRDHVFNEKSFVFLMLFHFQYFFSPRKKTKCVLETESGRFNKDEWLLMFLSKFVLKMRTSYASYHSKGWQLAWGIKFYVNRFIHVRNHCWSPWHFLRI